MKMTSCLWRYRIKDSLKNFLEAIVSSYSFKELQKIDLRIIEKWLKEPHVKEFWDDGESWEVS